VKLALTSRLLPTFSILLITTLTVLVSAELANKSKPRMKIIKTIKQAISL
jgi:hypothetical protein